MVVKPLILVILDGWGYSKETEHNAIAQADTPNWDHYFQHSPHTLLDCSGKLVGLPEGQMGNSEVGHLHMGAGRVVYQDLTRIDNAIDDRSFFKNETLSYLFTDLKNKNAKLHVTGLLSPGGVHSHENHLFALIEMAALCDFHDVMIHAILDGRDTPPQSAKASLEKLMQTLEQYQVGTIASIIGRYYAMDRDKRFERTQAAYDCLTQHKTNFTAEDPISALEHAYARGENDEFVQATLISQTIQNTVMQDGDAILFFNFRADRARQLSRAFTLDKFDGFHREKIISLSHFVSMTKYADDIPSDVVFSPAKVPNHFGEVISKNGLKQLRISETEKYAHVTFFFNGGVEMPFLGEERKLIPSPKVATYDLKPEMSAPELTDAITQAIRSQRFDVIIANYPNADMVGHSGNIEATIKAVSCIDECLGKIIQAAKENNAEVLITADHGNAEQMHDEGTGQAHTAHTSNPIPFVYIGRAAKMPHDASLVDIAPSLLHLLNLPIPPEMTGKNIISLLEDE